MNFLFFPGLVGDFDVGHNFFSPFPSISASDDRSRVEPLAKALEDQGWSVFWDRIIPGGKTWDEIIEEEIEAANCVIVVWSKISKASRWVRAEADEGLKRGILVPVSIEDIIIPLLFRPIQTVRLDNWQEDVTHPQFVKLICDLSSILGPSPLNIEEADEKRLEEERKHKEVEVKRKAEEERKRRDAEAKIKPEKPGPTKVEPSEQKPDAKAPTEPRPPKPRKTNNALKFGAVAGIIVLLIIGIGWWVSQQIAIKPVVVRKGKIFVASVPDNAATKILNIDEPFQQGMELKPGKYHVQVSSEGYETKDRWIELGPGEEKRINFELKKIIQKVARLFVETVPENATVKVVGPLSEYSGIIVGSVHEFQQGMKLEPGKYRVEVPSEGYEPQERRIERRIELVAGEEKRIRFELDKKRVKEPRYPGAGQSIGHTAATRIRYTIWNTTKYHVKIKFFPTENTMSLAPMIKISCNSLIKNDQFPKVKAYASNGATWLRTISEFDSEYRIIDRTTDSGSPGIQIVP